MPSKRPNYIHQNSGKYLFYRYLILLFPFLALFGFPLNFSVIWLKPVELLFIIFGPIALVEYIRTTTSSARRWAFTMMSGLVVLQIVYATAFPGAMARSEFGGISYVRLHLFPVYVCGFVLVIRYWLRRSNLSYFAVLQSTVGAICISGLLGLYAMRNDALRDFLAQNYQKFLIDVDLTTSAVQRFDMTVRAMSIYRGYDQASVQYAAGVVICIFLLGQALTNMKSWALFVLNAVIIVALILSIISSARTGLVVGLVSWIVVLFQRGSLAIGAKIAGTVVGIFACVSIIVSITNLFIDDSTVQRFSDAFGGSESMSIREILNRSEGVAGLFDTQYKGVTYPKGAEILIGLGDEGSFISDSAWVNHYVRFGILGLIAGVWVLIGLIMYSQKVKTLLFGYGGIGNQNLFSLCLPAFAVLYGVAGIKGPFYFLTNISAELFALILTISLMEGEAVLRVHRSGFHAIDRSFQRLRRRC